MISDDKTPQRSISNGSLYISNSLILSDDLPTTAQDEETFAFQRMDMRSEECTSEDTYSCYTNEGILDEIQENLIRQKIEKVRWAYWAGGLPRSNRSTLIDIIFSRDNGLGLTILRYNIGGGGFSLSSKRFSAPPLLYRILPGFKHYQWSSYNFSQDLAQRSILFAARSKGVTVLEAYAYSPPAWMTISGDYTGSSGYKVDNLDPSNYAAYSIYIADVIKTYGDFWGVNFDRVSPVNEAVEGWWVAGGAQEGCNFAAESLDKFLPFVQQALLERNLSTTVSGVDSWIINTPSAYSKFGSLTRSVIQRINVHSYQPVDQLSFTDSIAMRRSMAELAMREKKEIHVSEWGPQYLAGTDLDVALIMGRVISMDINLMGVKSWCYWQAVEDYRGQPYWGLVYSELTSAPQEFFFRKQYYVLMQFSKWVVPGSQIVNTDFSCCAGLVSVYQSDLNRIVLVVTNEYTEDLERTFRFKGFAAINGSARLDIYRTSENENHDYVGYIQELAIPGTLTRTVFRKSATTYIISGVAVSTGGRS